MSYTRVLVIENPVSWAEGMKVFRKQAEPALNAAKKAGLLNSYSMVQTGDHAGMLITEFDTKAKMNKYVKALSAIRRDTAAETGGQSWAYQGQVKASG
jgi:hypothetical protein